VSVTVDLAFMTPCMTLRRPPLALAQTLSLNPTLAGLYPRRGPEPGPTSVAPEQKSVRVCVGCGLGGSPPSVFGCAGVTASSTSHAPLITNRWWCSVGSVKMLVHRLTEDEERLHHTRMLESPHTHDLDKPYVSVLQAGTTPVIQVTLHTHLSTRDI
jgi:hypothetical protein